MARSRVATPPRSAQARARLRDWTDLAEHGFGLRSAHFHSKSVHVVWFTAESITPALPVSGCSRFVSYLGCFCRVTEVPRPMKVDANRILLRSYQDPAWPPS